MDGHTELFVVATMHTAWGAVGEAWWVGVRGLMAHRWGSQGLGALWLLLQGVAGGSRGKEGPWVKLGSW